MLVFVIFCKETRVWKGKKLISTNYLSIFFTVNFVLEQHIENTRKQPVGVIPSKCFSRKLLNSSKKPVKEFVFW